MERAETRAKGAGGLQWERRVLSEGRAGPLVPSAPSLQQSGGRVGLEKGQPSPPEGRAGEEVRGLRFACGL